VKISGIIVDKEATLLITPAIFTGFSFIENIWNNTEEGVNL